MPPSVSTLLVLGSVATALRSLASMPTSAQKAAPGKRSDAATTATAWLQPRATDGTIIGSYYSDSWITLSCKSRSTLATWASTYVRCCSTSGDCEFYTKCSKSSVLGPVAISACNGPTSGPESTCISIIIIDSQSTTDVTSFLFTCEPYSQGDAPILYLGPRTQSVDATASTKSTDSGTSSVNPKTPTDSTDRPRDGTSTAQPSPTRDKEDPGLSERAKIGIGVGVGVAAIIIALLAWLFPEPLRRWREGRRSIELQSLRRSRQM